jgi:hypothetical protein
VGGVAPSGNRAHGRQDVNSEILFLGLTIGRDRTVKRRPSFHYVAPASSLCDCGRFTAELLDKDRNTLICATLHSDCNRVGCKCWPKVTRDQIPYPQESKWLLVYEGEKQIYQEEIPDPPQIQINGFEQQEAGVLVKWSASKVDANGSLWYVVHWYDQRSEAWRGVAPRLQETSLLIPHALFAREQRLQIRVLATSGIATGVATDLATFDGWKYTPPTVQLLGSSASTDGPVKIGSVIQAGVFDSSGRQIAGDRSSWYSSNGDELASGLALDLRKLPLGRQVVRFATPLPKGGFAAGAWLIERTPGDCLLHQQVPQPPPKPRSPNCTCKTG